MTQYLNRIFLGQRAYGVGAAAEVYFNKRVEDLTLAEAALIAGLPRSPSRDNPAASVERARARRAYVLRRMVETGKIDETAREGAELAPVSRRIHAPVVELRGPVRRRDGQAGARAEIRPGSADRRLSRHDHGRQSRFRPRQTRPSGGPRSSTTGATATAARAPASTRRSHRTPRRSRPPCGNSRIRGSLHAAVVVSVGLQEAVLRGRDGAPIELDWDGMSWARRALPGDTLGPSPKSAADVLAVGQVVYVEPLEGGRHRLAEVPAVSAAFVALDPHDGAIDALVGGFDFGASKYNRAIQARRQPGSAFKPFLYSAALEHGFTPATLVNDAPIVLPGGGGDDGTEEWRPQNYSRRFYGPTPMREGLVRSRNLVSIRLLRGIGIGPAMRHIAQFGFGPDAMPPNLTLALGTGQVTPLDMARGFAAFANGGWRVTPYFVERIADATGTIVFKAAPPLACPQCTDRPDPAAVAGGERRRCSGR